MRNIKLVSFVPFLRRILDSPLLRNENKSNEWYPRGGVQISLHIRSPGFRTYGGGGISE